MTQSKAIVKQEDNLLWCLHVLGPDDVHPAPDRATAQLWAAQWTVWNQRQRPEPHLFDPVMSWIVAEWPHDAASHAAGLAQSIHNNLFPVDPLSTPPETGSLAELRAALEPFANWAISKLTDSSRHQPDSQPVFAHNDAVITLGDLRRARAAIASIREGEA